MKSPFTQSKLKNLTNDTTLYVILDEGFNVLYGRDKSTNFETDNREPLKIEDLETTWGEIFDSYGIEWNKERQLFRLLYDQIRLFITNFTYLRLHKINHLESRKREDASFNQFSVCLASMYLFGKKSIDLIYEIEKSNPKSTFSNKFSNTRNLIFEHNYSPVLLKNYIVEPSFFNSTGSDSRLEVRIHSQTKERKFIAYADYYDDYFKLESELVGWLSKKN